MGLLSLILITLLWILTLSCLLLALFKISSIHAVNLRRGIIIKLLSDYDWSSAYDPNAVDDAAVSPNAIT